MLGIKGGPQPKHERNVKAGHITCTATGFAKGPMAPNLFTYSGKMFKADMLEGTTKARCNKTENGWADAESVVIWAHMMVGHMKDRKLEKMLIFCDNAAIHLNDEVNAIFSKNKIFLMGLIPSATHILQPLDRCHFGCVKPKIEWLASQDSVLLSEYNVAKYYERATTIMEEDARKRGKSIMAAGFELAGIYPWDPSKLDKYRASGDARVGVDEEGVKRAKANGKAAAELLVDEIEKQLVASLVGRVSKAALLLEPMGEKAKEIRLGLKRREDGGDKNLFQGPEGFVGRFAPTTEVYAKKRKAELEAKAAEEAAKVQKAADAAEAKIQREKAEADRRKRIDADKLARAAKMALEVADKAARAAAKAAKVPKKGGAGEVKAAKGGGGGGGAPKQGKKRQDRGGDEYAKQYKKARK